MNITFKTGGLLADLLPPEAEDEQTQLEVAEAATPVDVMHQLGLPEDDFYLVILNDVVIPKTQRTTTILKAGDILGIFPPLKGG